MRRKEEGDVTLVLGLRIPRFGVAMAVRDRAIDRLVQKRGQVIGRAPGLAGAREQLGFHFTACGEHGPAGHPGLTGRGR